MIRFVHVEKAATVNVADSFSQADLLTSKSANVNTEQQLLPVVCVLIGNQSECCIRSNCNVYQFLGSTP